MRPLLCLLALFPTLSVQAIEWPAGYSVIDKSTSPDGRYGIIALPTPTTEADATSDEAPNYLVDVPAHQVLAQIEGVNYRDLENHRSLGVTWSSDSSFCVADYEAKWAFESIFLLQLADKKVHQTDIGAAIQNSLDKITQKAAASTDTGACINPYFRLADDGTILVRAIGTSNPKGDEDQKTYDTLFEGAYDPASLSWTSSHGRSIPADKAEDLSTAYSNFDTAHAAFDSPAEEAQALDDSLNADYRAAHFLLSPESFADVKSAQIAWLKQRDAIADPAERNTFVKARVEELQSLFWQP